MRGSRPHSDRRVFSNCQLLSHLSVTRVIVCIDASSATSSSSSAAAAATSLICTDDGCHVIKSSDVLVVAGTLAAFSAVACYVMWLLTTSFIYINCSMTASVKVLTCTAVKRNDMFSSHIGAESGGMEAQPPISGISLASTVCNVHMFVVSAKAYNVFRDRGRCLARVELFLFVSHLSSWSQSTSVGSRHAEKRLDWTTSGAIWAAWASETHADSQMHLASVYCFLGSNLTVKFNLCMENNIYRLHWITDGGRRRASASYMRFLRL